jgi:hypothetical protein
MRHHPRAERKPVLLCPQCRSAHVVYEAGLITGQVYHCLDCNYVGSFIIEVDEPDLNAPPADPK